MKLFAALLAIVPAVHSQSTPAPRLQGRVLFPDGNPAAGAKVVLVIEPNVKATIFNTDEQGRFFVKEMIGGRFVLAAIAPASAKAPSGELWAPTFFPNAVEHSGAQLLQLKAGADFSGFDIRLRSVPAFRI